MNILITGANRGLGLALASQAVANGHRIWAGVRGEQSQSEQLHELQQRAPEQVTIVALDVTDEASIKEAARQLGQSGAHLDALINSAAILVARHADIEDLDYGDLVRSFQVNTFGPMMVLKHFLPLLERGSEQSIINISSEAGSFANAYGRDLPYALSKAALNMFTTQMHKRLSTQGFQVYAIHPGWIRTDMGGPNAPGDPSESAANIIALVERKLAVKGDGIFIDHKGDPMPF